VPVVAAAVCPHPPLLVPELAGGAADELADLRAACRVAVDGLAAAEPDALTMVGSAATTGARVAGTPGGSFAGYGAPQVTVGDGPDAGLPLSLLIGSWLVERSSAAGLPRTSITVATDAPPDACRDLGRELSDDPRRIALLVMGDGSARRSEHAPMHLHPRAELFDQVVADALENADAQVLAALDPDLAADLGAAGRAPWQALAGAVPGGWHGELHYAAAPYGVGYFVASWSPG
jgi:hypothetical protein